MPNDDSQVALGELGMSLMGFDSLLKDLAHILRLKGELEIRASSPKQGSIIVQISAILNDVGSTLPFDSIGDFLDFLRVAGDGMYGRAHDYFNSIGDAHRTLNDWASKNPLDAMAVTAFLGKAFQKLIAKAKKQEKVSDISDPTLPKRIAEELNRLILKSGFKKALSPLIEDEVETIEISTESNFKDSAKIDVGNLLSYLTEEEMILPHLLNGETCRLEGTVTSLKSTRGDSLTFQTEDGAKAFNLEALPPLGQTSKDFKNFYRERVNMCAVVARKSQYQKPKLKIIEVNLCQPNLPEFLVEEEKPLRLKNRH